MTLREKLTAVLHVLAAGTVAVSAVACTSATGDTGSAPERGVTSSSGAVAAAIPGWRVGPGQFVSLRFAPKDEQGPGPDGFLEVALSSARTGAIIRRLLPASYSDGTQVAGLALDRAGNLWITYSRGPAYGGDTASGDPQPDSCGGQVDIVHAGTGKVSVFLRMGSNVLLSGATPSPDGQLLAYLESGCATGYFNDYLRVTRLSTGRNWTIGQDLSPCHSVSAPSWDASGTTLLLGYGPSAETGHPRDDGVCTVPWRPRLVAVAATAAQTGLHGQVATADPGCKISSAAGLARASTSDGTSGSIIAAETCGSAPEYTGGQAQLLVFDGNLHPAARYSLGDCSDDDLGVDQTGTSTLISCNTRLWDYQAGRLRLIATFPWADVSTISMLTWLPTRPARSGGSGPPDRPRRA
jgi:hypothetical protein